MGQQRHKRSDHGPDGSSFEPDCRTLTPSRNRRKENFQGEEFRRVKTLAVQRAVSTDAFNERNFKVSLFKVGERLKNRRSK